MRLGSFFDSNHPSSVGAGRFRFSLSFCAFCGFSCEPVSFALRTLSFPSLSSPFSSHLSSHLISSFHFSFLTSPHLIFCRDLLLFRIFWLIGGVIRSVRFVLFSFIYWGVMVVIV
jgi:hypothetical protein